MNTLKITIIAIMMGSGLISCDSNDQQEVNDALQEIQATGGEEGNIDPPEREE